MLGICRAAKEMWVRVWGLNKDFIHFCCWQRGVGMIMVRTVDSTYSIYIRGPVWNSNLDRHRVGSWKIWDSLQSYRLDLVEWHHGSYHHRFTCKNEFFLRAAAGSTWAITAAGWQAAWQFIPMMRFLLMIVVSTFFSALIIEEEDVLDEYCKSPVCK